LNLPVLDGGIDAPTCKPEYRRTGVTSPCATIKISYLERSLTFWKGGIDEVMPLKDVTLIHIALRSAG
jgi:hypothetical protein